MAANNLRVIYQNQADYTSSALTASSTASAQLVVANLLKDTRSTVWRSASRTLTNLPVVFKTAAVTTETGVHSGFTVTSSNATHATVTANGDSEAATATALPYVFTISDSAVKTSYTVRTYNSSAKTTLLDTQVLPVVPVVADAVVAFCSNNNHQFPTTDTVGTVSDYSNSGCNIWVYEGSSPLFYDGVGTTNGTYTVTRTTTSGTLTPGAISSGGNGSYAVAANHSASSTLTTAVVTYTITGKRRDGTAISTTTTQTFTKLASINSSNSVTSIANTAAAASLLLTLPSNITTKTAASVLTLTNIGAGGTMRTSGYSTAAVPVLTGVAELPVISVGTATRVIDSKWVKGSPWAVAGAENWTTLGTTTFGADRNCIRSFVPKNTEAVVKYVVVEVFDPYNTQGYIEASRLIVGPYWSPTYNTGYGMNSTIKDNSTNERSESGDLVTTNSVVYKCLNFELNWMLKADRDELIKLLKIAGSRRGIFVSLFPENSDDYEKENTYQIYGKLAPNSGITHPYLDMYATSVELEEV